MLSGLLIRRTGADVSQTHVYPAVFQGGAVLSQPQDEQAHVVLLPSSQAEAEAPLAALQLHHKTALQFTHKKKTTTSL